MRNFRTGIVIAALLVATPATDPQPSTGPLSIAELIEPKKVKTVSVRPDGTLLPNDAPYPLQVPQTGPYGAPAVTRDVGPTPDRFSAYPAAEAPASPSPILTDTELKQRRYEELLHARYDMYMRDFDAALKRGDEAVAHGADPWLAYENAREAKREAWQAINRMWLESQKP